MAEESEPRTDRSVATATAGDPAEQTAVTGRPNDLVKDKVTNTNFADRAKARGANKKAVDSGDAENKAVGKSERKFTKGRR